MEGLKARLLPILIAIMKATTIVTAIAFPLQIAMIAMGAKYKDECPVESVIPIYLIVMGVAGLVANCITCGILLAKRFSGDGDGDDDEGRKISPLQAVVQLLLCVWFICGSVWIYRNHEPNYDRTSSDSCDKTLYLFALWATTGSYILFGFLLFILSMEKLFWGE